MVQAATAIPRQAARPRAIRDPIGRSLIVVFLIKPIVDLFPQAAIYLGPIRLAPTTLFGVLLFFWLGRFLLGRGRHVPPWGRVFELFLLINALSLVIGLLTGVKLSLVGIVAIVFKMLDAYAVFAAAYLAAQRYAYNDITPFITAIVAGSALVVFINIAAINLGLTGVFTENVRADLDAGRERGLYFDSGTLANVAFYSLVFTVFRFHLARSRGIWLAITVTLVLANLYLVALAQSRSVMIELAIFGLIYMSLYQRAWGRIAAPVVIGVIIVAAGALFSFSPDEVFGRFEGDIAAVEEGSTEAVGMTGSGEISLGKYEALGNNRGVLWAAALTEIFRRNLLEIMIGNFSVAVGAHSDYTNILSRNGFVGLCVYLVLLGGLALRTFGYARNARAGHDRVLHFLAFTLVLCFILYALPFRPLEQTTSSWYMWTMLGFSLAWGARRPMRAVTAVRTSPQATDGQTEGDGPAEPEPEPTRWRATARRR